jgi:hypothetical protein
MSEHDPMFDSIPRYTMLVKVDYMGAGTGIAAEPNPDGGWINAADLPALIARVREDEREAANLRWQAAMDEYGEKCQEIEREACALIVEQYDEPLAAAIRARSNDDN